MLENGQTDEMLAIKSTKRKSKLEDHKEEIFAELEAGEYKNLRQIQAMIEKPSLEEAPSNLAIFGRYLLTPAVMHILNTTAPGAGGEIQLTDALVELLKTEEMYAIEVGASEGYDCGTIADWLTTNMALAQRDDELSKALRAACAKILG